MLTDRQRADIARTLDATNTEGILYQILENITRVFQPFVKVVGPQDYSKEYEINEEGLPEFQQDIRNFEEGGYYWEEYRLYDYDEQNDDEILYFDFNQDIIPVIDVLRDSIVVVNRRLSINILLVHAKLDNYVDNYLEKMGVRSGTYYYAKDAGGEETCKYYPKHFLNAAYLNNILEGIAGEKVIHWFDWDDWKRYYDNRDTSDCYVNAKVRAVRKKLKGCCCGFSLVTHPVEDFNTMYEVFMQEERPDIKALIQEYAKAKKYAIMPVFLRGCQITKEEANKKGMYALAKKIEQFEQEAKHDNE